MKHLPRWLWGAAAAGAILPWLLLLLELALHRQQAWLVVLALLLLWLLGLWLGRAYLRRALIRWTIGDAQEQDPLRLSLAGLSQPVLLAAGDRVLWYNEAFRQQVLAEETPDPFALDRLLTGLDEAACGTAEGQLWACGGRQWRVHLTAADREKEHLRYYFFSEETELQETCAEYLASRPGCIVAAIDSYEDVFTGIPDSGKAKLLEGVDRMLEQMIGGSTGFLRRVSGGRYIAVVEERHLEKFAQERYRILDDVRRLDPNVKISLSVGIGRGAKTLREAQDMAVHALDLAQGRGGDQAAEMTQDGFTFYGGVSRGVEKRSKVRSRIVAEELVGLIRQADQVVIMGHRMSDLDAIGAAEGVLRICKICEVPAKIAVRREATLASSLIEAFVAAGQGGDFVTPEQAERMVNGNSLCIVVDTYQVALVENKNLLTKCGAVVVIDHHRKGVGFIEDPVLVCHEPYASSASELVTELLQYVGTEQDRPTRLEAEGMLAGIMLDTQNFCLHTGARTFEAAAELRRWGAETEQVRALFNVSMTEYNAKAGLVAAAEMYRGCAVTVSGALPAEARVAIPQAANDLLTILDVEASFVAVQVGAGVNISARSMGAVNVQVIMEALGGGGHQTMAAAQLRDVTPEQARERLHAAIDNYRDAQAKGVPNAGTRA